MSVKRLSGALIATAALAGIAVAQPAPPETGQPLRIGFLTDASGSSASDDGPGSVDAARMAIEDFGGKVLGRPVTLLVGDHQQKVDVGMTIARQWLDTEHVDAIMDVNNSAIALAVQGLMRDRRKAFLITGAASEDLTGKNCSPFAVQWQPDTYALANAAVESNAQAGSRKWYFLTVDYTFGKLLSQETRDALKRHGGQAVGEALFPLGSTDYATYLAAAQAAAPDVLGLASSAHDTMNIVKQAHEFGITTTLVPLNAFLMDIHGVGLDAMSGVRMVDGFYWDANDKTRAWSRRFLARNGNMPTSMNVNAYRAVTHYLQAIKAAGTDDAATVVKQMKAMPIDDASGGQGTVWPNGRVAFDLYLYEVKQPSDSHYPWDYLKQLSTIPAADAYIPPAQSGCDMSGW